MKTENTLYIMCGLPGSGKSYQAEKLAKETGAILISSDNLRKELFGDEDDQDHNEELFKELHKRVRNELKKGNSVIYDACNQSARRRRGLIREFSRYADKTECVLVARLYEDCLKAQENRERKVSADVIKKFYHSFQIPNKNEGFDSIKVIYTDNNENILGKPNDIVNNLMDYEQHNHHHAFTLGEHLRRTYEAACKLAPYNQYIKTAALIHDIGKPATKTNKNMKGEDTSESHYYGHGEVSAYLTLFTDLSDIFDDYNFYINHKLHVAFLAGHHMDPYFWEKPNGQESLCKSYDKYKALWGKQLVNEVMTIHEADVKSHEQNMCLLKDFNPNPHSKIQNKTEFVDILQDLEDERE